MDNTSAQCMNECKTACDVKCVGFTDSQLFTTLHKHSSISYSYSSKDNKSVALAAENDLRPLRKKILFLVMAK